jgi:murein DD-endopeptidase MepM/ murein hydrolase activator NlpD
MRLRVLLACLLAPLAVWLVLPMAGQGQSAAKLEERIDRTREKIGRKKGTEKVLTTDITAYTRRIQRLEGRIGDLQGRQARLQADLDRKQAELVRIQSRLREERARLARLRERLKVTRRALARRLAEMYKAERPDVLTVVLNSDGFADLLTRGEFIRRIADQDRHIVTLVRAAKQDATETSARLDRLERRQQRVTAQVLSRRNEVAMVKERLVGTRVGYQRTRADKANALKKVRTDRAELQEDLKAMEAQQAQIRARLAAAAASSNPGGGAAGPIRRGSGSLIWPVNGGISSPFGMRWGRLHAGVDIPAGEGTPIRAADSGRVVLLGWTGGYGNYTCIQHNASLSTCYAHQSRYATSSGANVSQGQVIGYVGNTGNSFGAHLHFEVRVGGSPVDPMGYL